MNRASGAALRVMWGGDEKWNVEWEDSIVCMWGELMKSLSSSLTFVCEKRAWENLSILSSFLHSPTPLLFILSSGSSLVLFGPGLRFSLLCCHQMKDDRNKTCKYFVLISCTEHRFRRVVEYLYLEFLMSLKSQTGFLLEIYRFTYMELSFLWLREYSPVMCFSV